MFSYFIVFIHFLSNITIQIIFTTKAIDSAIGNANQVASSPPIFPRKYILGSSINVCLKKVITRLGLPLPRAWKVPAPITFKAMNM